MIKIAKADSKDSDKIAKLVQNHLGRDYRPFRITKESIEEKMKEKGNGFFIAIDGNRVVGTIRYSVKDMDLVDLRWLVVEDVHRYKGIGTDLLNTALKELKKRKMRKIVARIKSDSKEPITVFLKGGFQIEGYFREHYRKGTDIIQFSKFI